MKPEPAITGWKAIADYMGLSLRKAQSLREELKECGVIWHTFKGRPPRLRVCAFPERLRKWAGLKASKGQII